MIVAPEGNVQVTAGCKHIRSERAEKGINIHSYDRSIIPHNLAYKIIVSLGGRSDKVTFEHSLIGTIILEEKHIL